MIVLGIDPGPTLTESHCAFMMDGKFTESWRFLKTWGDGGVSFVSPGGSSCRIPPGMIIAAVIEWIRPGAGIYMRKGEMRPSRARAGKVLETHSTATTIRDALHNAGVAVYCVPRGVICKQAGCTQADFAVTDWLEMHGYIQASAYERRVNLPRTAQQIALGGDAPYGLSPCKRVTTPGLTTTHSRDALMAALFHWRDPRNAQYKYTGNGGL